MSIVTLFDWNDSIFALGASVILTGLLSAYMLMLRVPSVLAVRPELRDVGLITGLFSGRGDVYVWHHYTLIAVVFTFALSFAIGLLASGSRSV
jgi:hypothetical protein